MELSTTEAKIEDAAKDYAKQKFNSEHFRESCAKHFTAGASFATTDPLILQSLLQPFAEWFDKHGWVKTMAGHWLDDKDNHCTFEQVFEKYIQHLQTNKDKEDARP